MSTRLKSLILAINVSLLMWVGLIGGGIYLWNHMTPGTDPSLTASIR